MQPLAKANIPNQDLKPVSANLKPQDDWNSTIIISDDDSDTEKPSCVPNDPNLQRKQATLKQRLENFRTCIQALEERVPRENETEFDPKISSTHIECEDDASREK